MLSKLLKKEKIKHNVLNARNHAEEASIIASAGIPNSVTIATNMAGRGTDIQLGGNKDMIIDHKKNKIENIQENKKLDGVKRKKLDISLAKKNGWKAKMNFNTVIDKTVKDFKKTYK